MTGFEVLAVAFDEGGAEHAPCAFELAARILDVARDHGVLAEKRPVPGGAVQRGRLLHRKRCLFSRATLDLITLPGGMKVFHDEAELAGARLDLCEQHLRRLHCRARAQLAVEVHLARVVALLDAGGAADRVG